MSVPPDPARALEAALGYFEQYDRERQDGIERSPIRTQLEAGLAALAAVPPSPPLIEALARAARRANSVAAAPDYDEEAIRDALWHVVDLVLAAARGETREEPSETCPSCGGDAGDNWFDRSLCPCNDTMHTRCRNCGTALDGCTYEPAEEPSGGR